MVTDYQVKKLSKEYQKTGNLSMSAMKSGMHRHTGKKYLKSGKLPRELKSKTRKGRTRKDPFEPVHDELIKELKLHPKIDGKTLLEIIMEKYPEKYNMSHLRTMQRRLREFEDHELVGEVRGRGLIAAVETVANKTTGEAFDVSAAIGAYLERASLDNGLILRGVAGSSIAFCPPLIITESQVDEMIEKFARSLDQTLDYVKQKNLLSSKAA